MRNNKKAFSLIEVLVAVAVFGIAITIFTQSLRNGLLSIESARRKNPVEQDLMLVRRHVLDIKEKDTMQDGGEMGTYSSGNARWDVDLEDTDTADFLKMTLNVEFREITPRKQETQVIYIYRKDWMDSSKRDSIIANKKDNLSRNG